MKKQLSSVLFVLALSGCASNTPANQEVMNKVGKTWAVGELCKEKRLIPTDDIVAIENANRLYASHFSFSEEQYTEMQRFAMRTYNQNRHEISEFDCSYMASEAKSYLVRYQQNVQNSMQQQQIQNQQIQNSMPQKPVFCNTVGTVTMCN